MLKCFSIMSDYIPSRLTAIFVILSALGFILIPGIYGAVLYVNVLQALTGIHPNEPLQLSVPTSFGRWLVVISMLIFMSLGFVLGAVAWTILLHIILPSNAARYWARYPAPYIPILTPFFEKVNDWIMNFRRRNQKQG